MPRRRRVLKRRALPSGLAQISHCERAWWSCHGPLLESDTCDVSDNEYHRWPDWDTWATFYATVRDELYAGRPWRAATSIADALYLAWLAGDDPGAVRETLWAARDANDPRRLLDAA